jgi:hypothetical protein
MPRITEDAKRSLDLNQELAHIPIEQQNEIKTYIMPKDELLAKYGPPNMRRCPVCGQERSARDFPYSTITGTFVKTCNHCLGKTKPQNKEENTMPENIASDTSQVASVIKSGNRQCKKCKQYKPEEQFCKGRMSDICKECFTNDRQAAYSRPRKAENAPKDTSEVVNVDPIIQDAAEIAEVASFTETAESFEENSVSSTTKLKISASFYGTVSGAEVNQMLRDIYPLIRNGKSYSVSLLISQK